MTRRDEVYRVRDALVEGELRLEDLKAREIGDFLGATTSVVYHHWGSLDAFLFEVAQAGYELLRDRWTTRLEQESLEDVAVAFVEFGLDHPDLYSLMFERRYDWEALRERGAFEEPTPGLEVWEGLVSHLDDRRSNDPDADARLVLAGLHGLVSLAYSGRANIGTLERSDRELAEESARQLIRRIVST